MGQKTRQARGTLAAACARERAVRVRQKVRGARVRGVRSDMRCAWRSKRRSRQAARARCAREGGRLA